MPSHQPEVSMWVDYRRSLLMLRGPYSEQFNNATRGLAGRRWNNVDKVWEFDIYAFNDLIKIVKKFYGEIKIPPLGLLEIWGKLTTDDLRGIYKSLSRTVESKELMEKIQTFFVEYAKIDIEAKKNLRLIRPIEEDENDVPF